VPWFPNQGVSVFFLSFTCLARKKLRQRSIYTAAYAIKSITHNSRKINSERIGEFRKLLNPVEEKNHVL
jgi:hypothetical protein